MARRGPKPPEFAGASAALADGLARIAHLYGLSPLVGRLYAALFLATEPIALDDLCKQVGAAKSTVSVALRKLSTARVVKRRPPGADRRDHYEAVTDPWTIIADWVRMFLQPELEMWRETGGAIERALATAEDAPRGAARRELDLRLARLRDFTDAVERFTADLRRERPAPPTRRSIAIEVVETEENE